MKNKLVIYGCGAFALEILSYIQCFDSEPNRSQITIQVIGVIDEGEPRLAEAETICGTKLSHWRKLDDVPMDSDLKFIIATGNPTSRARLLNMIKTKDGELHTVIHDSAFVAPTAKVEKGVLVAPFAFVGPFATLQENTVLNTYASVGHDSTVEKSSVLSPYSALNGNARLGECSLLGSTAIITPGVSVGSNCKVSAGSIAYKNAENNSLVYGNPAKSRVMFRPL